MSDPLEAITRVLKQYFGMYHGTGVFERSAAVVLQELREAVTITTVEQLDALPVGAAVKFGDGYGGIYEKDARGAWWSEPGDGEVLLAEADFYATVLWEPAAAAVSQQGETP